MSVSGYELFESALTSEGVAFCVVGGCNVEDEGQGVPVLLLYAAAAGGRGCAPVRVWDEEEEALECTTDTKRYLVGAALVCSSPCSFGGAGMVRCLLGWARVRGGERMLLLAVIPFLCARVDVDVDVTGPGGARRAFFFGGGSQSAPPTCSGTGAKDTRNVVCLDVIDMGYTDAGVMRLAF